MATHAATRSNNATVEVSQIKDSLVHVASVAVARFDRVPSPTRDKQQEVKSAETPLTDRHSVPPISQFWMQPPPARPSSFFGKSVLFVSIAAVHALVFFALSSLSPQMRRAAFESIQVVMLTETPSKKDIPPPPKPKVELPEFHIPIDQVVINIAEPETAITVASQPTQPSAESAPAATAATPKVVSSVEYIREPATKYPPPARALKQRGTVMLRALIDADGHAREVNVHRSSGYRLLDDAARAAVFNALFKPYTENGRSLPVYVFIPIEFGAV